jgi:hypothetical protein
MQLNREGIFHANPVDIAVNETGQNNLATVVLQLAIIEEKQDGEFVDIHDEQLTAAAYVYLERKDGSINEFFVNSLKEALGWDGRNVFWLQDNDLSDHPIQITTGFEDFNGKTRLKVQFVNPYGSEGRAVKKADGNVKRNITARIGSKLRAIGGGTSMPAAKPKTAKPTAKAATAVMTATADEAWKAFSEACKADWPQERREKEWFRILEVLFPGKDPNQFTPADWAVVIEKAPGEIVPF